MDGESPNNSAFICKTFEASREGENVVRFQKFFLLAYFFIKTHGKINNNSDFLKMSKIWTGLVNVYPFSTMMTITLNCKLDSIINNSTKYILKLTH